MFLQRWLTLETSQRESKEFSRQLKNIEILIVFCPAFQIGPIFFIIESKLTNC